jgi:holo-[acyl-carrier protein] synthase
MIYGIGLDIVEIARVREVLTRRPEAFLRRLFTEAELAYCNRGEKHRLRRLAARFAAKEAVLKSLGTGLRGVNWTDVEVVHDPAGKPAVRLHGRLAAFAAEKGIAQVLLSLTHSRDYAAAQAVAMTAGGG